MVNCKAGIYSAVSAQYSKFLWYQLGKSMCNPKEVTLPSWPSSSSVERRWGQWAIGSKTSLRAFCKVLEGPRMSRRQKTSAWEQQGQERIPDCRCWEFPKGHISKVIFDSGTPVGPGALVLLARWLMKPWLVLTDDVSGSSSSSPRTQQNKDI